MDEFNMFRDLKAGFGVPELLLLAFSIKFKEYSPLDIICRIGDTPNEIYYVLDGKIAVTNLTNKIISEDTLEAATFHHEYKGSVLGEASILYNSNRYLNIDQNCYSSISLEDPSSDDYKRTVHEDIRRSHKESPPV